LPLIFRGGGEGVKGQVETSKKEGGRGKTTREKVREGDKEGEREGGREADLVRNESLRLYEIVPAVALGKCGRMRTRRMLTW
jgi:hypothetical protein